MAHNPFKSVTEIPAKLPPYVPVSLRDGIIARLAEFGLNFIKRDWLARRLFDLAYEQMPAPSNNVLGVAVADAEPLGGGLYVVNILVDGRVSEVED